MIALPRLHFVTQLSREDEQPDRRDAETASCRGLCFTAENRQHILDQQSQGDNRDDESDSSTMKIERRIVLQLILCNNRTPLSETKNDRKGISMVPVSIS